jgi:hypothetical protein
MFSVSFLQDKGITVSDRYAGMPPKKKRFVKAFVILPTPVIVGALVLSNYIEPWVVFLIVGAIAAVVFVPLARAAAKEERDIAERESGQ